jgi:Family of unknown function (DUF5681)
LARDWEIFMSSDSGYGKPPFHSRFKPGESGNPAGRPKGTGTVSFRADFAAELAELICEGRTTYTKKRAIVKNLVSEALAGDTRAALAVIALCAKLFPEPEEADHQADPDALYLEKLADRERLEEEAKDSTPSSPEDEA